MDSSASSETCSCFVGSATAAAGAELAGVTARSDESLGAASSTESVGGSELGSEAASSRRIVSAAPPYASIIGSERNQRLGEGIETGIGDKDLGACNTSVSYRSPAADANFPAVFLPGDSKRIG